jgi:hypothetical protein
MIVHHGRDPGDEAMKVCVEAKPIPENRFRGFRLERWEPLSTTRGNEVNRIVSIPMLEAMTLFIEFSISVGCFSKVAHEFPKRGHQR